MRFLFGRKRIRALAEILQDSRAMWLQEIDKDRERIARGRGGPEPILEIPVFVQPEGEPPFEAMMKAGLYSGKGYFWQPGVKVLVEYKPGKEYEVKLVDDDLSILNRNPQLVEK